MPEFVEGGHLAVALFLDSGTFDELKFCYEPLANLFRFAGVDFCCRANGPCGKPLSGDTGASQYALFNRTQLLKLGVNQLIQGFGNALRDGLNWGCQCPLAIDLRNQSLLRDVLEDRHHEERVATRPPVDQAGKSG